ncbi:MAG: hypothetical protein R8G66_21430 [Cytophagales bacterium]|nr:hypothetical protein [Cytophagales bacterium]
MNITTGTKYIISTSGRPTSIRRYERLLQDILGLNIAYLPISAKDDATKILPDDFVNAISGLGAIGGAISKDIKGKVIHHLDELDDLAARVQSVNTVIRKGDRLLGYNTDAYGFEQAIKEGIAGLNIETALVYGYGGVFNVVYHVLKSMGLKVYVTGRRSEAVVQINEQYGLKPHDGSPKQLFINASPVTDKPLEEAPGFLEAVEGAQVAFDHEMPGQYLMGHCQAKGIKHIPGTAMYYPQMYRQWALFLAGLVNVEDIPGLIEQASGE